MMRRWRRSPKLSTDESDLPPPPISNQDLRLPRRYRRGTQPAPEPPINVPTQPLPEVYPFAEHLARRLSADRILDLGTGVGQALAALDPTIPTVGVDNSARNLSIARSVFSDRQWLQADLTTDLSSLADYLDGSVVVLANVLEQLPNPIPLLDWLHTHRDAFAGLVVAGPDRARIGEPPTGPPAEGVATWTLEEWSSLFASRGLRPLLHGHTRSLSSSEARTSQVLFVPGRFDWQPARPIRAVAYVPCYNEVDIIDTTVARLLEQGLYVHIVDNWSTDGSLELLRERYQGNSHVELTRWPDQPSPHHQWYAMLDHIDRHSASSDFDWILLVAADEQLEAPTPDLGLLSLMELADANGYDVIDCTLIDFRPERPNSEPREHTRGNLPARWEFATRPGARSIERMWRNRRAPAGIAPSGGHAVTVAKRVFPSNAILRHYPLRSPEHARQKVLVDRLPRFTQGRSERGWHVQYDEFAQGDATFLWDPAKLNVWEWYSPREWVIEFASRCGIPIQD